MDSYERLADTLDKIPNGFAKIDDGTHLKVLQWIFTPGEAELASKMKLMGETREELMERLDLPLEGLEEKLEKMAGKGQIRAWNSSTGRRYALIPFAVGIYEEQLKKMDGEFAQLMEDYFMKGLSKGLFDTDPALFRVIPINRAVKTEVNIYPYEIAEGIIKDSSSWGIRECICKKQQELLGNPCKYPTSVCLLIAKKENVYDNDENTEVITEERSLEILREAEEAGLIHCAMNIQTGTYYICNCCTCCCNILRSLTISGQPLAFVNSNYWIKVDEQSCTGCETCVDRCQFNALEVIGGVCEVDYKRCIGCGVCAISCSEDALSLVPREPSETKEPPVTMMDWMTEKAISRDVDPSDLL